MRSLPSALEHQAGVRIAVTVSQMIYLAVGYLLLIQLGRLTPAIGASDHGLDLTPAYVALSGVALTSLSSGMLRSIGRPVTANTVGLIGVGILPLVSFAATSNVEKMLLLHGVLATVLTMLVLLVPPGHTAGKWPQPSGPSSLRVVRSILGFGWRRVPGDAALPALFATPAIWVAHTSGVPAQVAAVGFTSSSTLLILAAFGILTPVLLPLLSTSSTTSEATSIHRSLFIKLQFTCMAAAVLLCVIIVAFSGIIVTIFLGNEFSDVVNVLRIGVVTTIPMAAFYAARPLLETYTRRSVTTRILLAAWTTEMGITVVTSRFVGDLNGAIAGWVICCFIAGALTLITVARWNLVARSSA